MRQWGGEDDVEVGGLSGGSDGAAKDVDATYDDYDVATGARLRQTKGGYDRLASFQNEVSVRTGSRQFVRGQHRCGSDDQS